MYKWMASYSTPSYHNLKTIVARFTYQQTTLSCHDATMCESVCTVHIKNICDIKQKTQPSRNKKWCNSTVYQPRNVEGGSKTVAGGSWTDSEMIPQFRGAGKYKKVTQNNPPLPDQIEGELLSQTFKTLSYYPPSDKDISIKPNVFLQFVSLEILNT